MSYKKGKNGEDISDDGVGAEASQSVHNGDEEAKIAKSGNKRGRPRKNQNSQVDTNTQKSKRGRKPKATKLYDFEPNDSSKIRLDVADNDSDDSDDAKISDEHDGEINNKKFDMGFGPIESVFNNYMNETLIPSNPPQFQSPTTLLRPPKSPNLDYKSQNMFMISNQNPGSSPEENPIQKKLTEIIAQSFNNHWNSEPKKRKDTEVDFAKQYYPTLNQ